MLTKEQMLFTIRIMESESISNPCAEDRVEAAEVACALRKELHTISVGARYIDADYGGRPCP